MGLFDKVFGPRPVPHGTAEGVFKTLTAYSPVFSSWRGAIYESERVRAAIDAKARHASKLNIVIDGTACPITHTALKNAPNEWQTWGQFLYRTMTILECNNTCFIVPVFDVYGRMTGIFPVLPTKCEIKQYSGEPWLQYTFVDGKTASVELKRTGILTKHQYKRDFFGDENTALDPTMQLITLQNQGIAEGIKNGASYRFMARMNNFSKDEDLAKERKRFNRENFQGEGGGILLVPSTYTDFKQLETKSFVIDAEQMKLIDTNVYNYFGVNEDVLQNKAFGDAWSAFYEGAIEPFAIQLSDVLTRMIYTREQMSTGNRIMFTANRLQYMTTTEKLNVSAQMADRGIMSRNEIREIWNLPALPDDIGNTFPVRGEYYDLGNEDGGDNNAD